MNPSFQEWLGIRYTEKCDFLSALSHYKKARDLRVEKPSMKDTLLLWQVPVHQESYEDKERKKQIVENKSKKLMNQYHNLTEEQVQEMKRLEESNKSMNNTSIPLLQTRQQKQQQQQGGETQKPKKDFAWFSGRHEDANTIIYLPPPQGWHVD
jgi:endonuclease I